MTNAKNDANQPDEPRTRLLILLIKAVEVAHEKEEAAPGRHSTHGKSDSRRLEAHDHVLLQRQSERRGFSDTLSMPSSFELLEGVDERGHFEPSAPVVLSTKHLRVGLPRLPSVLLGCSWTKSRKYKINRRCKRRS